MATNSNDIRIAITGDTKDFDRALNKTEKEIKDLGVAAQKSGNQANSGFSKMSSSLSGMVKGGLIAGFVAGIIKIGKTAISEAAKLEQLEVSFEVMLGSAEKAKKMIADLQKVAASTPYGQEDVAKAAQTMLGFGVAAEKVIPYVKQLGDIAMGNRDRFKSLSLAFAQTQAAGKLMGQDLLQMINAGFNPLKEISRKTGKSIGQLKDEMSKGAISAKMVADAFKSATEKSGSFYKMSEKMSKTVAGMWSTMKDNAKMAMAQMGKELRPTIIVVMKLLKSLADSTGPVAKAFQLMAGVIIKTFQTVIAAIATVNVVFKAAVGPVQKAFETMIDSQKKKVEELKKSGSVTEYMNAMNKLNEMERKYNKEFGTRNKQQKKLNDAVKTMKDAYKNLLGINDKIIKQEGKKIGKIIKGAKSSTPPKKGGKVKQLKDMTPSQYLAAIGKKNAAEIAAEKDKTAKLLANYKLTEEQKQKIIAASAKRIEEIQKKQSTAAINNVLNQTGQVASAFGELSSIVQMAYDNQMKAIDIQLNKRLEAIDIEEQRYLESIGVKEETELMKAESDMAILQAQLDAQTDARKKAAMQIAIDEKKKEVDKLKAQKKFDEARTALTEEAEKKKRLIIRKTAIAQKAANIVDTIQNTAVAVMKAFAQTGPLGGIPMAAFLGGLGAAKVALIAQQPLPEAAEGAFISGSSDGTLMRVAERGRSEAVLPLQDNTIMSKVGESIASAISSSEGGEGQPLNIYIGNDLFYEGMYDASKRGEIIIDQRAVVTR